MKVQATKSFRAGKGVLTVNCPDHPFTFDGPDSLISDKQKLIAIFRVRNNEVRNPGRLLCRLINSVVAYPAETEMILLLGKDNLSDIGQLGQQYFSQIAEERDIKKLHLLFRDKKSEHVTRQIKSVQHKLFRLQAQIQNDNLAYISKKAFRSKKVTGIIELKEKAKIIDPVTDKETTVRANIFKYQNSFFGIKNLTNSAPDLIELRPFYEFALTSSFHLDNGVPYIKALKSKALNLNDIPTMRFDPIKPLRVASLLGWHIVNTTDFNELENRIAKVYRK